MRPDKKTGSVDKIKANSKIRNPHYLWDGMKNAGIRGFLLASPLDATRMLGVESNKEIYNAQEHKELQDLNFKGTLTPSILDEVLVPFVNSLSSLQHVIDQLTGRPYSIVTIEHLGISTEKFSRVSSAFYQDLEDVSVEVTEQS